MSNELTDHEREMERLALQLIRANQADAAQQGSNGKQGR